MSYNSELQLNNTNLQNILDAINNLPEAENVQLPTLENPGTASDLAQGKELIDADGNVVTGDVVVTDVNQYRYWSNPSAIYDETNNRLELRGTSGTNILIRQNAGVRMYCAGDKLGNATPADVRQGVTFTSAAGLKVTGTMQTGTSETWTLTLEDGSTVEKVVYVK